MKGKGILLIAAMGLLVSSSAWAQQPEELPDLKRDEDWTKQFMTRDQAEDLLEPFELAAFGKISDVAGAADELGAKIVGENRSARLKGGQRVLCKVALTEQGRELARGARFTVTTRAKTFFTNLYKNFFQIHYAEGVGEGTSLADVIVKTTSTRGRPFLMIHPAGDDRFYFTFTANTDGRGAIRSHIEPTFFKKTDGPVIITGDPIPIATCCIDVKETIGRVPKFRGGSIAISISSLWGKIRISILFRGLLKKCLAWKVKKIRDAHQNDECKPFEIPDVIIVLSGENLPIGVSPNNIQIGEPGECQVTKVLQSSETSCTLKAKLLKHEPGFKDVQMTTAAGETIIAEDILEFTRIMTISPECIDYGEEQFAAIVTMDSQSGLDFDSHTDGEFLTFADERAQAFNLTPTLRKSDTELETITSGGELNAATMVIEGFCPGAGMVKACPRNWAVEFPDGFPPGEFELPEDFQPCCGSEVKVLPVFTVEPDLLVSAIVQIDEIILDVPQIPMDDDGEVDEEALAQIKKQIKKDLCAKVKANTKNHLNAKGVVPDNIQFVHLVGEKLPDEDDIEECAIGEVNEWDCAVGSGSLTRIIIGADPLDDVKIGLKKVRIKFLGKWVESKDDIVVGKAINDVVATSPGTDTYVAMRFHTTDEALDALDTQTFQYEWAGQSVTLAPEDIQSAFNVSDVTVDGQNPNKATATLVKQCDIALLTLISRGTESPGGDGFRETYLGEISIDPGQLEVVLFDKFQDSVAVVSITGTIASTPCKTIRAPVTKSLDPRTFKSTETTATWAQTKSIVLIEGSTEVPLVAEMNPASGVPQWVVQRNTADAPALKAAPFPVRNVLTLTVDGTNARKAKLKLDAVGSFSVVAFINKDSTPGFDPAADQGVYWNLVVARVTLHPSTTVKPKAFPAQQMATVVRSPVVIDGTEGPTDQIKMRNGAVPFDFNNTGLSFKNEVDVVCGGGNGRLGIERVLTGWVNNVETHTVIGDYQNNHKVVVHLPNSNVVPLASNPHYITDATKLPTKDTPTLSATNPYLDTGRTNRGTGGKSSTLGSSRDKTVARQPLTLGQRRTTEAIDSPGRSLPLRHPKFPNSLLVTVDYTQVFKAYLVVWTGTNTGAEAETGANLYMMVNEVKWRHISKYGFVQTDTPPITKDGSSTIKVDSVTPKSPAQKMTGETCPPTINQRNRLHDAAN